jgi:hypothetical protein
MPKSLALWIAVALLLPATAAGSALQPRGEKIFFGITDTGDPAQFGEFSQAVHKHPAVIESFRTWGSEFPDSIRRWQTARARPMIHITTADNTDGHELITPQGIAQGGGDDYLVRLNRLFWAKKMPAYIRPLGEPNRCLNVYAAFDCEGKPRDAAHSPYWYRQAFRRMYIILHGGGKKSTIDARLADAGLSPLQSDVGGLPRAPIAVIWSPLPTGSPKKKQNRPAHFYPGDDYVDWVGTDFYAEYPEWKALNHFYDRFHSKPFALTEWGVSSDDSSYVQRLMTWARHQRRCKMLVYYQDFGTSSPYRIQDYPASLSVLRRQLHSGRFPSYAPDPPHLPPPPPGGVEPRPAGK